MYRKISRISGLAARTALALLFAVCEIRAEDEKKRISSGPVSQTRPDPFLSLIRESPEEIQTTQDDRPQRKLSPLEKLNLSQLKLVAVIFTKNRKIAMVEEAGGRGYEIRTGSLIGKNKGKVSEIRKESIIVKEILRDHKGRPEEHFKIIKFNRKDNER